MDRKYKKGGDAGSKGVRFQVSLLTLFLLKAIGKLKDWSLSTENNKAGKFDDVVLEYSDGAVLLQAKHKENKKTNVTLKELLSSKTNDDFSLPKYFLSYQEIKCRFNVKNVILCTNANFNRDIFPFLNSETSPESMLYYQANCLLYTFNDSILPDLKNNTKIYLQQSKIKNIDESVINDENLKDFLEHLQLYFNYPSGNDLENVIRKQLFVAKGTCNFINETSPSEIYSKMMDWFQQKDGENLTEIHAKAMFFEIKRDKYWQRLEGYDVFFQPDNLKFDSTKNIFHIVDDGASLLREIQIYRTLQDIKTVLCVRPESGVDELKEILEAFELAKFTFLTIIWYKAMEGALILEVTSKLKEILNNKKYKDYKKVIFLTGSKNELARQLQLQDLSYDVIHTSVKFDDLLDETRENVLKKTINFQGNTFNLEKLFGSKTTVNFGAVLKSEILEELIRSEEVTVGRKVHALGLDIEYLYINRTFIRNKVQIEQGEIFEVNEKVILISDGPGMGKSTVLTSLAISIKKTHPHLWIIKIVLSDYTKVLKTILSQNRRTLNTSELLNSQVETRLTHQLEQLLFSMNNRVVLMLDGVDEISPNYTELVENLIAECQQAQNIAKVVVTSRPHVTEKLEKKLKIKSFKLQSFTEQNQIDFLTSYWSHNLELNDKTKAKCERYAKALLNQMWFADNWLYREGNNFASIPLQVRMLAEIFQERSQLEDSFHWHGCREYLETNEETPNLPKQINYAKLFTMFVDKKKNVYLEKLTPDNAMADISMNSRFDECLKYHRAYALETILDKHECELFTDYKHINNSVESEVLNIGIIQTTDNRIHFIHRTFVEYFVAECLVKELQYQNRNVEFQKFLIDEVLQKDKYFEVSFFFDNILQDFNSLPSNIFKEYQCSTFRVNEFSFYLIHDLARRGCVAILQLILKIIDFEVIKPSGFKEFTPFPRRRKYNVLGKLKNMYRLRKYRNTLNVLRFCVRQCGVNIRNRYALMPLHDAIDKGHLDMVKFLVEKGSNINCNRSPNQDFDVPLYRAVRRGYFDITKFLVEQGANIRPNSEWGYKVLYDAVFRDYAGIAKYLLEKILETDDSATNDPFVPYTAAYLGQLNVLQTLLRQGASANNRIPNGETLLFGAARGGQPDIIQYLVGHGADINSKDGKSNTALHIIAQNPSLNLIAKLLIELEIDINVGNSDEDTAFQIAAKEGNLDAVKLLIETGANVITKDWCDRNVLHLTKSHGHLKMIELLIQTEETHSVLTVLDIAMADDQIYLIKYFLAERDDGDISFKRYSIYKALSVNIKGSKNKITKFTVELKSVNHTGYNKAYEFFYTGAQSYITNIIFLLIKSGSDFIPINEDGNTALHLAVDNIDEFLDKGIIELLVDFGVDINVRNKNGYTALHTLLYTL